MLVRQIGEAVAAFEADHTILSDDLAGKGQLRSPADKQRQKQEQPTEENEPPMLKQHVVIKEQEDAVNNHERRE
jgi:hypothetical protein